MLMSELGGKKRNSTVMHGNFGDRDPLNSQESSQDHNYFKVT